MPSYKEKLLAKAQQGIAPREKVAARQGSVLSEPKVIADASTPAKITSNVVDKVIETPIANAKQQVTPAAVVPAPVATGQVAGQVAPVAPVAPATIPLRETLEQQGVNVYWNPKTGQVTANGMPVDTSRMNLSEGRYSANQEDINAILEQVQQGQQQDVQQQGPVGQYQEAAQTGAEQKQDILGKYSEQVAGITEDFQNRQPLYTEDITNSLRQAFGDPFEYDPNKDPALQEAQKYAEREIVNAMNARGVLNSTITRDEYASMLSSMIPKYESIAYDRYQTGINNQLKKVSVLRGLSQDDYNRYKDTVDLTLNNLQNVTDNAINMIDENLDTMYKNTIELPLKLQQEASRVRKDELDMAYDKLQKQGYVDNEISSITGIAAGTLSKDAKKILGNYIINEEEKDKLLSGEMEMAEIEFNAKQEELAAAKEEVLIKNQVQSGFAAMASELNQMSADEAINSMPRIIASMREDLGEYYQYIADDINKLQDDLLRRRQKEVDQQMTRQKESRLATAAAKKETKEKVEDEGLKGTMRTRMINRIDEVAEEVLVDSSLTSKRNFVDKIQSFISELSDEDQRIILLDYGITDEDIANFETAGQIKPITGIGGKPLGVY
jgi:hypothetical protein